MIFSGRVQKKHVKTVANTYPKKIVGRVKRKKTQIDQNSVKVEGK